MPDTNTLLDQLEEWLEAQVPTNLHELPYKMLETMERVTTELFDALNMHGPPSISIPFPPFSKDPPAPPAPPPVLSPLQRINASKAVQKFNRLYAAHPYATMAAGALVLSVGIGAGGLAFKAYRKGKFGTAGRREDGMLKDAIVILSPSPMPPILWTLTVSLLRAGYIVLVAVPNVDDAEQLEKRLTGLASKNALRVLIYDAEDSSTFPPFNRSLQATLNLRFQAPDYTPTRPLTPTPANAPRIHAFVSLYPLHPDPPTQPGPLPALPTLLSRNSDGSMPKLITLYSSSARLVKPDSFASQLLAANHQLLGRNLAAFSSAQVVSVHVGDLLLPTLHSMIHGADLLGPNAAGDAQSTSKRQAARERLYSSRTELMHPILARAVQFKDVIVDRASIIGRHLAATCGLFGYSRDYYVFEHRFLRLLKNDYRTTYHFGQNSYLSLFLSAFVPSKFLSNVIRILPSMLGLGIPDARGPLYNTVQGLPAPRMQLGGKRAHEPAMKLGGGGGTSASSGPTSEHDSYEDHEHETESGAEDLASSFHTTGTNDSRAGRSESSKESGSGSGLGDSWVGLDGQ